MSCVSSDGFRADREHAVLGEHERTWELIKQVSSGNVKGTYPLSRVGSDGFRAELSSSPAMTYAGGESRVLHIVLGVCVVVPRQQKSRR